MWQLLGNVSKEKIIVCKKLVEQGFLLIKIAKGISIAFPLSMFNFLKCLIIIRMKIKTKQNLLIKNNRDIKTYYGITNDYLLSVVV